MPLIRPAHESEVETLLAIQRAACVKAFAHIYPPDLYPFPDDGIRDMWRESLALPDREVYLSEVQGKPVGSVAIGDEFLRNLYVVPEHWRTGVGGALHDHAVERLRSKGEREAKLWTLEENWSGRDFYEHRGWTLNGETRVVPFPPNPTDVGYSKTL